MTGLNTPRWIIITPTPEALAWRQAIDAAAADAGLTLIHADTLDNPSISEDSRTLILTDSALVATQAGAETIVAIIPDPAASIAAIQAATGAAYHHALVEATNRLAQSAGLDPRHKVIGQVQIDCSGGSLSLFDDLTIIPPPPAAHVGGSAKEDAIAVALFELYRSGRPSSGASSLWGPDLFNFHEKALVANGAPGEMDITGRPRFLVTGPYIVMPVGRWTAKVRFSVDDAASVRTFRLDWGSTEHWKEQSFKPRRSGVYEMTLEHQFLTAAPCEVRFVVTEGCFTGAAVFISATITRESDPEDMAVMTAA